MNWLQRFFYKAAQAVLPNPIFAALQGTYGANQPQRMANDYPTWSKEGYCGNDTVYKCISYLSRNAALVDWGLYTDRFQREEIESHPLLDLWYKPNPDQYLADFVEDWAGTLLLGGNGFIKSEYITQNYYFNTPPDALFVLRPDWVSLVPGDNGIVGYEFGQDVYNRQPIPPFQIAHSKYWNPGDPLRGLSPIQVAAIFIDMQTAGNKWNLGLLQNSARPPGTWTTSQMLSKTDFDNLKNDLNMKYAGYKNAGTPPVLYGGLQWQNMSLPPAELDWLNSRTHNANDIANIYNLDPSLVGDTSASTMNNKEQAKLASYFEAVFPMVLNKLQATANRWLVPKYGDPRLFLAYKPESIPAIQKVIQDQLAAQSDRATKIYLAGGINLDEYREACGYDGLPAGAGQVRRIGGILVRDTDLIVFAQQSLQKPAAPPSPVPENLLDNPPPAPAPLQGGGGNTDDGKSRSYAAAQHKILDLKTAAEKSAYVASLETQRQTWEATAQQKLQDYFKQEQQLVHHAIDQAALPASAIDRVELALKQLQPHLTDVISGIWHDVGSASGKAAAKQFKSSDRSYERKGAEFFSTQMINYLLSLAGQKVVGINQTILDTLRIALANGVEGGESIPQLAKRVDDLYLQQIIPNRSQVIAATEVCAASNWGAQQAAQQSGLTLQKEWLSSPDGHTRPWHAEANGQIVGMNEPFVVHGEELQYPGDPNGSGSNVINCRCTQVYSQAPASVEDIPVDDNAGDNSNGDIEQMARRLPAHILARKRYVIAKTDPSYDRYRSALKRVHTI